MNFNCITYPGLQGNIERCPNKFSPIFWVISILMSVYIGSSINNHIAAGHCWHVQWQTDIFSYHSLKKFAKFLNGTFEFLATSVPQDDHIQISLLWNIISGLCILTYWIIFPVISIFTTAPTLLFIPIFLFLCKQGLSDIQHIFLKFFKFRIMILHQGYSVVLPILRRGLLACFKFHCIINADFILLRIPHQGSTELLDSNAR